jgi:thiamine biosynthesis protein ThiI
MSTSEASLFLVRLSGELTIKSRRTRRSFQQRLRVNVEDALRRTGTPFRLRDEWGRFFVEAAGVAPLATLARVFGLSSISRVEVVCEPSLERILEVGERSYAERVRGRSFAVRARVRARGPLRSREVNYGLGAALCRHGRVDLDEPDVEVHVEIHPHGAYFFSQRVPGAGGLPLGGAGSAVALISGGYDSAVAAWMMLRRGLALHYVFCNLGGAAYERSVLRVAKVLTEGWSHGARPRLHVVDFAELLRLLRERTRGGLRQVVLKRLMYRTAERIGREVGALALVTGESVGQVSSQTLANLRAISSCTELPVLRPLAGFDKEEIIARSREIGTYELSCSVREYCAVERRPRTAVRPESVAAEENRLDLAVLDRSVAGRRVIDLRSVALRDTVVPYLFTTSVPADAVVIDTRRAALYDAWHYPGAVRRDLARLSDEYGALDRTRTYVLCCDVGVRTAELAERMQRSGFEAYSFAGGVPALRRWAESTDAAARSRPEPR